MPSQQELQAVITAVDRASAVLKQVANEGDKMGKALDNAGKQGGKSFDDLSKRGAALGAVLTSGAAILGQWSRSAQDAAAIQAQLQASVAAAGDDFALFGDAIQQAGAHAVQLGIDDEKAFQAISALTQITGSTAVALQELGLAEDIAAAKGIDLTSAAELVGRVYEGNYGTLARYGIIVDQTASREQVLAQIQAQVSGQAEAHATAYARIREELSNLTDQIGSAVSGFTPMLALLPGVSSGFSLAGAAIGALAPELTAATAATAALDLALGPVGLVLAAVAAGAALVAFAHHADAVQLTTSKATKTIADFTEAIAGIGPGAESTALTSFVDVLREVATHSQAANAILTDQQDVLSRLKLARDDLTASGVGGVAATQQEIDAADAAVAAQQAYVDSLDATIVKSGEFKDLQAAILDIFSDQNPLNAGLVADEMDRLRGEYEAGTLSADDYIKAVKDLDDHHKSFGLTLDELAGKENKDILPRVARLGTLTTAIKDQSFALIDYFNNSLTATDQTDSLSAAMAKQAAIAQAALVQTATLTAANTENAFSLKTVFDASLKTGASIQADADAKQAALVQTAELTSANTENAHSLYGVWTQSLATADAMTTEAQAADEASHRTVVLTTTLDAAGKAAFAAAQGLGLFDTLAKQLRPIDIGVTGGDKTTGTAAAMQGVASGMDAVLGNFKVIDELAQRQEAAGSIAENLIGKPGEWAEIDKLVARGEISQSRYNQTVEAGTRIAERQRSVEQNLNVIRARQLPLLDQQDKAYAKQIANITHMTAAQQEITLGFMDSAEAQKVQTAVTLAADAANTKVGSSARNAAQEVIAGAAAADPVFAAMAESIGLITTDKTGKITVNFDNADSLNADIEALTASVDALTVALGGVPPDTPAKVHVDGADEAKGHADDVHTAVDDIPPGANVNITASDSASGVIAGVSGALDGLNGKTANTFINTIITTVHNDLFGTPATTKRHGGVVPYEEEARNGLVTGGMRSVLVGEAGPETVLLPGGSYVRDAAATAASRGGGAIVNITFTGDIRATDADEVFAAFARAARTHFAGLGV